MQGQRLRSLARNISLLIETRTPRRAVPVDKLIMSDYRQAYFGFAFFRSNSRSTHTSLRDSQLVFLNFDTRRPSVRLFSRVYLTF